MAGPAEYRLQSHRGRTGEIEKFLFYRGLGNFPMAVSLRFDAQGNLVVKNGGAEDIPFLLVYDRAQADGMGGNAAIWWQGPLAPGEAKSWPSPTPGDILRGTAAMENLHQAMVAQGLYTDEARALLNTWYNGYFIERASRPSGSCPASRWTACCPWS